MFTHDAKLDVPALMAAFTTDAGYIGALGSRKTTHEREARLREAGAPDADLARVFAPAGLDIGAATVEETAIAVLGEITAHRSGRPGAPLRETSGAIRREQSGSLPVDRRGEPRRGQRGSRVDHLGGGGARGVYGDDEGGRGAVRSNGSPVGPLATKLPVARRFVADDRRRTTVATKCCLRSPTGAAQPLPLPSPPL